MSKIKVTRDLEGIKDLCLIETKTFIDGRGSFTEIFNEKELREAGIWDDFVQDNLVYTYKGVVRGFHVNLVRPQAKLIRVLAGKILDVVIDYREDSETYLKRFEIDLDGDSNKMLYIPEKFAHAYKALKDSVVVFKVTTHFVPGEEIEITWTE